MFNLSIPDPVVREWRARFMTQLYNLQVIDAYINPVTRKLNIRAVESRSRCVKRLPPEALYVGRYKHPFSVTAFVDDMHDAMESFTAHSTATEKVGSCDSTR